MASQYMTCTHAPCSEFTGAAPPTHGDTPPLRAGKTPQHTTPLPQPHRDPITRTKPPARRTQHRASHHSRASSSERPTSAVEHAFMKTLQTPAKPDPQLLHRFSQRPRVHRRLKLAVDSDARSATGVRTEMDTTRIGTRPTTAVLPPENAFIHQLTADLGMPRIPCAIEMNPPDQPTPSVNKSILLTSHEMGKFVKTAPLLENMPQWCPNGCGNSDGINPTIHQTGISLNNGRGGNEGKGCHGSQRGRINHQKNHS